MWSVLRQTIVLIDFDQISRFLFRKWSPLELDSPSSCFKSASKFVCVSKLRNTTHRHSFKITFLQTLFYLPARVLLRANLRLHLSLYSQASKLAALCSKLMNFRPLFELFIQVSALMLPWSSIWWNWWRHKINRSSMNSFSAFSVQLVNRSFSSLWCKWLREESVWSCFRWINMQAKSLSGF